MKITPYDKVLKFKALFSETIIQAQRLLPTFRSDSFKFWFYIKGVCHIHLDIPNFEKWMGDRFNEDEMRMFRLVRFWLFCALSLIILQKFKAIIF